MSNDGAVRSEEVHQPNPPKPEENPDDIIDPTDDIPAARLAEVLHELGQFKGVNIAIEMSDTFAFETPEAMTKAITGEIGPDDGTYIYSRSFNPTVKVLSRYLAALEDTQSAYCTSSGMSAITAVIMHLCAKGGHVVAAETLYGGSHYLLKTFLPEKSNISTTFVDITDLKKVKAAIDPNKTKVLFFESVANPALIVANIPELSKIAKSCNRNVQVVVDNTFTPMILSPKKLGADVVIHSLTKYVSGGSDIIAGAICGSHELIKDITNFGGAALMMLGPVMNPKEAFELVGRMAHTSIRVKKHCNRALKLAQRMRDELNLKVIYPGLDNHPDHQILNEMRNKGYGFGGVVCLDMETEVKAYSLLRSLKKHKFGFLAVSLGYYETLMSCPGATTSENSKAMDTKRAHVISPGYIRLSIGYMGTLAQKWEQFKRAWWTQDLNPVESNVDLGSGI